MRPTGRRVLPIALVAVAVAAVSIAVFHRGDARDRLLASGTLEATEAALGFQVPGRLAEVAAREGESVKAGAVLARLDTREAEARRDQAEAQVAAAQALLRELERGFRREEVAQGLAARDAARDRLNDAERDLARTRRLFEGGAVSQEVHDKAVLGADLARRQYQQAEEQARLLETGTREERVAAQRAQLAQAEAALRAVEAALEQMTVRAPFDGIVTRRHREPGEIVPAGSPVVTLMNPADRWVRIYVPEPRIGAVRLGTAATLTCDTYPRKSYEGCVSFIASEAEFTPKTVQTAEERVKLVFAVKVAVSGDAAQDLKPGMPVDVRLQLGAS